MNTSAETLEVAILGGGLAGLGASMECGAPVFEAASRAGGVAASDQVDGFSFDRGIHVLNSKSPKVLSFLADLGLDMVPITRVAQIYSHKVYTAYPFQVNTAGLPLRLRINSVWGFFNRNKHPDPTNYEEWMYRNIGTTFADTFLIPYSEKFWGVSPKEMTFEWTGNKVPMPSTLQVVRGALWSRQTAIGSNAMFHYPKNGGGYGAVARALEKRAGDIRLNHRAVELDTTARQVTFENGARISYDTLVNTIPINELVRITTDAPDEVREAASKLRTNSIRVVNLGIRRANVTDKHWVHFPEKDISFFRISSPSNFSPDMAPPGMSSISAEVSYDRNSPPDSEELFETVRRDLVRVGLLRDDDEIVVRHSYDIPFAYCIYDRNRKAAMRTLKDWYGERDVITCGRFGLWTYFWSDEAINSGRTTGRKVLKRMNGDSSVRAAG